MLFSRKEVVEIWIKVISSVFLLFAAGVIIYFSLTELPSSKVWLVNFLLLPLLLLAIGINFTNFSSFKDVVSQDKHDLDHLLLRKPDWQHDVDAGTWVSLGKFIRVGLYPDGLDEKVSVTTTSPLERLVAIKKQGYWLPSSK